MLNAPSKNTLALIPTLNYNQINKISTRDTIIHMHLYIANCNWWISEYDPNEDHFYGFVNLNDPQYAEWGYGSYIELVEYNHIVEITYNTKWVPTPVKEIPEILNICKWLN